MSKGGTPAARRAVAAYAERQKDAGWLRANLVLSPEDTSALGRLMAEWGVSRQEAVRRAIRIASLTADRSADVLPYAFNGEPLYTLPGDRK